MRRATSTRRKNSNANTVGPTRTPPKSTSNHSHLAVKNGAANPTEKDNEAITVGMVGVAGSTSGSGTVPETITNAEVVVTETETLLPKKAWLYTLG